MPISHSDWYKSLDLKAIGDALDREHERWNDLTPQQRKVEQDRIDARQEKCRKHVAWLDWCVANKVDPNLVK